jgi:DNA-binding response OmpR family regulator
MTQTIQSPSPASTEPSGAEAKRKRILLVEGDGFTRLVLLLRLRLAGFAVDFTSNGVLGLGKLRNCHPDVLLVDLKLCGLSGLELIKAARTDAAFGNRPIYVFTRADQMNRATRKEIPKLDVKLFDKRTTSREDLVQLFAATFLAPEPSEKRTPASKPAVSPTEVLNEMLLPAAINEIIAGVREQTKVVVTSKDARTRLASCGELLSRVSSLGSCAEAAGLPDLNRQAKALENFLNQLCNDKQGYSDAGLNTMTRAVDLMRVLAPVSGARKQNLSEFSAVIVDEAPSSNNAIKQALLKAGFNPTTFNNPSSAYKHLATNSTDLVVANILLPEAHGLTLADIRKLPLQAKTPVIFVPESSVLDRPSGGLPPSEPRLDTDKLLLKELIVRALNAVQSTGMPAPASPALASPAAVAGAQSNSPLEDGFEMFAVPNRPNQDRSMQAPAAPEWTYAKVASPPSHLPPAMPEPDEPAEPVTFFNPASLPTESRPEAEPGAADTQIPEEIFMRMPATPIDQPQTVDQPVEALQPTDLQLESAEQTKPEQTIEDLIAEAERLAAAENNAGEATTAEVQPQEIQAPPTEEFAITPQDQEQNAENQLPADQDGYAPAAEYVQPGEQVQESKAMENEKNGREELMARICAAEMELYRKNQDIEALQAQLEELAADKMPAGRQSQVETPNHAAQNEAQARCTALEQEIAQLRKAGEELKNQLAQEQQAAAELRARLNVTRPQVEAVEGGTEAQIADLEQQVRQGVAALTRATADLAKERGERQRSEQRTAELNARLQELHKDFSRTLQAQHDELQRTRGLEEQLRQTEQNLERRNADVEQQQAERLLAEEQLHKAKELNAQFRKNLAFFEEANKNAERTRQELQAKLEANLDATLEKEREGAEGQRLAEAQSEMQRELQEQIQRREKLEKELQANIEALHKAEAKLQKETAERQRLAEALEAAQLSLRDRSERSELEFSNLQSALQLEQVERNRQEAQLARVRHSSVDSIRAARALRSSLRRQIREPIDNLYNSARGLLELEMGEQQKKLAEAVLQDVLLVHARLREPELAQDDSTETEASPATTAA